MPTVPADREVVVIFGVLFPEEALIVRTKLAEAVCSFAS
jgi:hypothetical protein